MCTTISFPYEEGVIFGRTLEIGIKLDHHLVYIPENHKDFIHTSAGPSASKYAMIGTGFLKMALLGDGINSAGLMGSSNLFPGYASFAEAAEEGEIGLTDAQAFNYLLSRCTDVEEVRKEADRLTILKCAAGKDEVSTGMHFFFTDAGGRGLVLEPKDGRLLAYDNPFGVLTNAPEFPWHRTNLKNYINLQPENVEEGTFNGEDLGKFGEGSGMAGLPGDFTPPSRFIRSAFFVSATPKTLGRQAAILQGFRILSQADIPTGAVIDPKNGYNDETLYTGVMDSKKKAYFVKCHGNINIQSFYLDDYQDRGEIQYLPLEKTMSL